MSLLPAVAPMGGGTNIGRGQPAPQGRDGAAPRPGLAQAQVFATARPITGGTAPGEITATASRVPPVTAARAANATSNMRPGAEGRSDAAAATAEARSRSEARARDEAEAVRREAIHRELISRIPVPVAAIPKLMGDVDRMRSLDDIGAAPGYDRRA